MSTIIWALRIIACVTTRSALGCMLVVGAALVAINSTGLHVFSQATEQTPLLGIFLAATLIAAIGTVTGSGRMPREDNR